MITKILDSIRKLLPSHPNSPIVQAAFTAVKSIALTMRPGEESALTSLIPIVLAEVQARRSTASAIAVLVPLSFVTTITCRAFSF
jgi:U3 small nucleolar RNA-associated protein 10